MADIVKVTRAKDLRGKIINKLYLSYGEDISLEVLRGLLRFTAYNVQEQDIKKAIYYLGGEGKRYVKLQLDEENYMDSKIWLTPAGVNLAEGDITDVGVEMHE
ncbi:MAG: hypothetical protein IJV71_10605 [Lachnospiraceae bacterium]|nr:hypothetical protein [Lachnospiraceae bacterium]